MTTMTQEASREATATALARRLAEALTSQEVGQLADARTAERAIDKVRDWRNTVASQASEVERAQRAIPKTEDRLNQAKVALRSHEKNTRAKKSDPWAWGRDRSKLLDEVQAHELQLEADVDHARYIEKVAEETRGRGPS